MYCIYSQSLKRKDKGLALLGMIGLHYLGYEVKKVFRKTTYSGCPGSRAFAARTYVSSVIFQCVFGVHFATNINLLPVAAMGALTR